MKRLLYALTLITFIALSMVMLPMAVGAANVTLGLEDNSDGVLTGYRVYYRTDPDSSTFDGMGIDQGNSPIELPIGDFPDPDDHTVTLTGLVTNNYSFVATAYDADGNESEHSNLVDYLVVGAAPQLPATPHDVAATYNNVTQEVTVTWGKPTSGLKTKFWRVYHREVGQSAWEWFAWCNVRSVTKAITKFTVEGQKTFEFVVIAYNSNELHSSNSDTVSVEINHRGLVPPALRVVTTESKS